MDAARLSALLLSFYSLLFFVACGKTVGEPNRLAYDLVASTPHDSSASTQGLLLHDGAYYESTGGYERSTLRRVDPESGRVLQLLDLPFQAFGEGLALRDGRLYQLEWKSGRGFIYDRETFEKLGNFQYEGEGWGLAWNGEHFILSDGTATLRFLEPESFEVARTVTVHDNRGAVDQLNELEWVEGRVYANRWHTDEIVVIDPGSGIVEAVLNLAALERPRPRDPESVLNGIAYDPETSFLHVTGKRWPRVHVLRIRE